MEDKTLKHYLESKLNELIERGKGIADKFKNEGNDIRKFIENKDNLKEIMSSLLEGFNGVERTINKLCEKLSDSRNIIGENLDLPENHVFTCCLTVLNRAMGLWYRGIVIFSIRNEEKINEWRNNLMLNLTLLGQWVGDCIRWSCEANPPIRPLHDLLMETTAIFADNLVESLKVEKNLREKGS